LCSPLAEKIQAMRGARWATTRFDGNGALRTCSSVNPYNFPSSMVPECWNDATQKNVTR